MTENEAIKKHIEECECRIGTILGFMESNSDADISSCEENISVLKTVIIALEEIQEYRALGALEKLREAMEKQRAKKPIMKPWTYAKCPSCGASLSESLGDGYYRHHVLKARCDCGQNLDWSKGKE